MRLSDRKSKLAFITNSVVRYRGKLREVVVEVEPDYAVVRLLGTRIRYSVSWRGVYELAGEIFARNERERRKAGKRKSA